MSTHRQFQARFIFDLDEAMQALADPIEQRLYRMLDSTRQTLNSAVLNSEHPRLLEPRALTVLSQQVFAGWLLHFLRRHCFLSIPIHAEDPWVATLIGDADFLNEAQRVSEQWLYPIYWITTPSQNPYYNDTPDLKLEGTVFTLTFRSQAPEGHIPAWVFDHTQSTR